MDGQIVIGTEVDTKNLAKGLKEAEAMLKQFERESEGLEKAKLETEQDISEGTYGIEYLKEATQESLNLATTEEERKEILAENNRLINLATIGLEETKKEYADINEKIVQNKENQEAIRRKISKINEEIRKTGAIDNINGKLKQIGNSIDNTAGKMVRWGLALIGVRSAAMLVRRAISMVSSDNDVIAAQMQQMRNVIANSLFPLVNTIMNLVAKIMVYINSIFKFFTGKDLFNFSKAIKSGETGTGKMAKNLKEANKQLAGFDEMNVLSDNSSSSGGSTSGAASTPEVPNIFDQFKDIQLPENLMNFLEWIKNNADLVISGLLGIAAGLTAVALGFTPLVALGIGLVVAGIVLLIQDIIKFIKDPSWNKFANILRDLALILAGVAIAMIAVNAANPVGWIILAIALITALVAVIIKHRDEIKEWLLKVGAWINEHVIQPVVKFFKGLWEAIKSGVSAAWDFVVGVIVGVANWINEHIIKPIANFFVNLWNGIKNGVKGAIDFIKNVFNSVVTFFKNIISTIVGLFKKIGTKVGDAIGGAFKIVINGVLSAIENILNFPIKSINKLIDVINKVPGINLGKLTTFNLPRLAKGGIINQPSRGVAVGGEAGMEGVIPLTDSQQMRMLGEAIGRYITINFTNVNSMNGRVISREVKKIDNDNAFASNR